MKNLFLFALAMGMFISCNKDEDNDCSSASDPEYLIFGHFYGECFGESCVETFKLTDTKLYEDTIDDYSGQNLAFIELSNEKFELANDLDDYFPLQLLGESETVFGCPDCSDGGGLFIQYSINGNVQSWRIDQEKSNVPSYIHDFMDEVNERIELINN
jgi:hypothetical protein